MISRFVIKKIFAALICASAFFILICLYDPALLQFYRLDGQAGAKVKEWKTSEATFAERKRRLADVCRNEPEAAKGKVNIVYNHDASGVIWGFAAKAGCTFWKRVFKDIIQGKTKAEDMFKTSKQMVHLTGVDTAQQFDPVAHDKAHFPIRFVVARDPFSRLMSTWLDKVYLPDLWKGHARPMVLQRIKKASPIQNDFIRQHFDQMAAKFDTDFNKNLKGKSTWMENLCGKYLTFAEFIAWGHNVQEDHSVPLSQTTNPCKLNVTHVTYMETFTQDARYILEKLGLPHLLDHFDRDAQVMEELRSIVDYNFWLLQNFDHIKSCTTPKELAYRLWNNFRWRGYIHPEAEYIIPQDVEAAVVRKDLEKQIQAARSLAIRDKEKTKKAKKEFLNQFYLTLGPEVFKVFLKKYEYDFKLYGYESLKEDMGRLLIKQ